MGLLEAVSRWFRPSPVETVGQLAEFMDSRAAFMAQKCVVEYARARSGVLSSKLFKEPTFSAALRRSRWVTYTITFCDIAEMVEGLLRHRVRSASRLEGELVDVGRRAFAAHGLPEGAPDDFWEKALGRLERRMAEVRLHAPKAVKEIPKTDMEIVFANLPIHESLRGHDYELVQNNLRTNLVRVHEDFLAAADFEALTAAFDRA